MTIGKDEVLNFLGEIKDSPYLSAKVNPLQEDDGMACAYYREDTGHHCLVGYFLHHNMNVPNEIFASIENVASGEAIKMLIEASVLPEYSISEEAIELLGVAQNSADYQEYREETEEPINLSWGEVAQDVIAASRVK